jgi:branched-subunit amino acid aminotransferase/4-amino-4-deoxychorismate lyase
MRKGKKATRDQPLFYEELKKKHGIWLTNTAWEILVVQADIEEISVSEFLERYARSFISGQL